MGRSLTRARGTWKTSRRRRSARNKWRRSKHLDRANAIWNFERRESLKARTPPYRGCRAQSACMTLEVGNFSRSPTDGRRTAKTPCYNKLSAVIVHYLSHPSGISYPSFVHTQSRSLVKLIESRQELLSIATFIVNT